MARRNKHDRSLRLIRRMLLLPAEEADPTGYELHFGELDELGTRSLDIKQLSEKVAAEQRMAWHRDGLRGRIATGIWRAASPTSAARAWRNIRGPIYQHLAKRSLSRARVLNVKSLHINRTDSDEVEVFLDFGDGKDYTIWFEIYTRNVLRNYVDGEVAWAEKSGRPREALIRDSMNIFNNAFEWIIVPHDTLNDERIKTAISEWYQAKFEWKRGHWSQREGVLPEVIVDIAWETPEEADAAWEAQG